MNQEATEGFEERNDMVHLQSLVKNIGFAFCTRDLDSMNSFNLSIKFDLHNYHFAFGHSKYSKVIFKKSHVVQSTHIHFILSNIPQQNWGESLSRSLLRPTFYINKVDQVYL